jgi:hypothetical protein
MTEAIARCSTSGGGPSAAPEALVTFDEKLLAAGL